MDIKVIRNKQIYIVENHHEILEAWDIYKNKGLTIITLDSHTDTKCCFENFIYYNKDQTADSIINNYSNNIIDIHNIISKLKKDEHIDFAVRSGMVNKVFVISYSTSNNMTNNNIFSDDPIKYNNELMIEYNNFTTLTSEDSYIQSRVIALTQKVLVDATNYFSSIDKNYASKYILDIDLDYICTIYAFDEDLSVLKDLIKNAEAITIAKESSFVKIVNESLKNEYVHGVDDRKFKDEVLTSDIILVKLLDIIYEIK